MPRGLSPTVIARIEDDLRDLGPNPTTEQIRIIASNYDCSERTVYKHKSRAEAGIPVQRPSGGPRRVITWKVQQAIKLLLDQRPWFYQDEIADFLLDAFDIEVSQSTISRTLQHIRITRKKLKVVATQQNNELRTDWLECLQYFTADQIVSVNESGSDDRAGDRQYGWSTQGARAIVRRWFSRGRRDRVSVLAGYTIEGYIAATTFYGTCTGDLFEGFIINELLPLCNPYLGPRLVIILDNALVHHSNRGNIEEACRRHGVLVRFLPLYSPDFNLIKESFNNLKAFIRRFYRRERNKYLTY
jgi:transposase